MRNIKLTLEYDGSRYNGWTQPPKKGNKNTISGKMIDVLSRMESLPPNTDNPVLFCGEKTAPGVHALKQIANFKTNIAMPVSEIQTYLNHYLPQDIAILSACETDDRFHAELTSHTRIYEYRIRISPSPDLFRRKYCHYFSVPLDIDAMRQAAEFLEGTHDFACFSSGKTKKSTIRELEAIDFQISNIPTDEPIPGEEIRILLKADGFLQKMPLALIGTLLDIGLGKRNADCIARIFTGQESPSFSGDPYALFLQKVE